MQLVPAQAGVPGPGANPYHAGLGRRPNDPLVVQRVMINGMQNIKQAIERTDGRYKNQRVRLSRIPIPKSDCEVLHSLLCTNPSVVGLELLDCEIEKEHLEDLFKHMKDYHLETAQLSRLPIDDSGAALLAVALQETHIKNLDLSWNEIGKDGAVRIAHALQDSGLQHLSLAQNRIGHEAAEKICEKIGTGGTMLKSLDLSRNEIIDPGALALADVLPNSMLEEVAVRYNRLTPRGVVAICQAVAQSKIMRELALAGNQMGNPMCATAICEMMQSTKTIEFLDLSHCNLTANELPILAKGVMACPSLRRLKLSKNMYMADAAVQSFFQAIRTHAGLQEVDIAECDMVRPKTVELSKRIVRRMTSQATRTLILLVVAWTHRQRWDSGLIRKLCEALGEDPLPEPPAGPPVYVINPAVPAVPA